MDRLRKFIRSLSKHMRVRVAHTAELILKDTLQDLDIKPMKGSTSVYRCRIGDIRIIFQKTSKGNRILDIDFRGNIYKRW